MIEPPEGSCDIGDETPEPAGYLELPASKLLEVFGSGSHVPGSGAAAALMGMLACRLCSTVLKLTLQKPNFASYHSRAATHLEALEQLHEPNFRRLFAEDCEAFSFVMSARRSRDLARGTSGHRRLVLDATESLRNATEIPLRIAQAAFHVAEISMDVFDRAYPAVRGDSGAAISAAVSAARSAIFVALLNLNSFGRTKWSENKRQECRRFMEQLGNSERRMMARVMSLDVESIDENSQLTLF